MVFVVLLGLWLILTIMKQFSIIFRGARRDFYDPLQLVPTWTFFAPLPVAVDYHVFYRDYARDGAISAWQELHLGQREPGALAAIWNPDRRIDKALIDLSQALITSSQHTKRHNEALHFLVLSLPYLIILSLVAQAPPGAEATARQFMIAETCGALADVPARVLFRSAVHALCVA